MTDNSVKGQVIGGSVIGQVASDLQESDLSNDGLIGHRVRLLQPNQGYRAGSDAVFLAASVHATVKKGKSETILDAGCGAGAVALCLAHHLPAASIDGLDVQGEMVDLFNKNARENKFDGRLKGYCGDIADPPVNVREQQYDQVVTNPPFFSSEQAQASPHAAKDRAHRETLLTTDEWLAACLRRLRSGGVLTLVQSAERLPDVLAALNNKTGDIIIFPIWSHDGEAANRVIVKAVKGRKGPARLQSGIVVHDAQGARSEAAEKILRQGNKLEIL